MTTAPVDVYAADIQPEDYLVLGLATCFVKQEGEVLEIQVIEPIPSAALEALLKGIPTSYQMLKATAVGAVIAGETGKNFQAPPEFPATAMFGDDFVDRAIAAVRTYKRKPSAQGHIPPNSLYTGLQYSLDRKRVLNSQRVIRAEDNVKQHAYTHQVL